MQRGTPDKHKIVFREMPTSFQKIVFREMADEHPDADTGNVIVVLQEQEHSGGGEGCGVGAEDCKRRPRRRWRSRRRVY